MNDSEVPSSPGSSSGKKGIARLIAATGYSIAGFKAAYKYEEAGRLELFAFFVLAPVALFLGESNVEKVLLLGSLVLVMVAELINSAIEAVVDRVGEEDHELAGRAKDLGSAAVLLCMLLVLFVWGLLLL